MLGAIFCALLSILSPSACIFLSTTSIPAHNIHLAPGPWSGQYSLAILVPEPSNTTLADVLPDRSLGTARVGRHSSVGAQITELLPEPSVSQLWHTGPALSHDVWLCQRSASITEHSQGRAAVLVVILDGRECEWSIVHQHEQSAVHLAPVACEQCDQQHAPPCLLGVFHPQSSRQMQRPKQCNECVPQSNTLQAHAHESIVAHVHSVQSKQWWSQHSAPTTPTHHAHSIDSSAPNSLLATTPQHSNGTRPQSIDLRALKSHHQSRQV